MDDRPAQTESPPGLGIVRREQLDKVSGLSAQTSVSREEADGNSQKELKFVTRGHRPPTPSVFIVQGPSG